jgi:hypothetical protein
MNINELPAYDATDNPTGCCPRFNPKGWDRQDLHFAEKRFAMARTRSVFHIPINMSQVFKKTLGAIERSRSRQAHRQDLLLLFDVSTLRQVLWKELRGGGGTGPLTAHDPTPV